MSEQGGSVFDFDRDVVGPMVDGLSGGADSLGELLESAFDVVVFDPLEGFMNGGVV